MKKIFPLLFIAITPLITRAQSLSDSSSHALGNMSIAVNAEGFFFDAEYGTPFAKGYTVTGFRLSPTLVHDINERAQLRVGFNAMMLAGLDSLYNLRPALTLIYQPASWLTFVAGTLLDGNHHQLPAPVTDPSRYYLNYQEDGIQILTNTKIWKSDTWLDWMHYLTPWTADQERFTMGTKHELTIISHAKPDSMPSNFVHLSELRSISYSTSGQSVKVSIPTHFIANHRGGELKTIDTNTVTHFNERVGLHFEYSIINLLNSNTITIDVPFFFYHLDSKVDHGGNAFHPSLSYFWSHYALNQKDDNSTVMVSLGYWHGNHYFSPYGSPLFWSINSYSRQHIPFATSRPDTDIRNLLTGSISFEHIFKEVAIGLRVDALHDLNLNTNDFVFSFFLTYKGHFKIL